MPTDDVLVDELLPMYLKMLYIMIMLYLPIPITLYYISISDSLHFLLQE